MKVIVKIIILSFIITSCKNPFAKPSGGGGGGGGGGVPSSEQMNSYLEDQMRVEIPKCSTLTVDDHLEKRVVPFIMNSGSRPWKTEYSNAIAEQFDKPYMAGLREAQLKDSDLEQINCPGYNTATPEEKKKFWVLWMASIAKPENNFKTANKSEGCYHENDGTDSCGLLQIDKHRANDWCGTLASEIGKTVFNKNRNRHEANFTTEDMLNPEINLKCGLLIMDAQIHGSSKLSLSKTKPIRPQRDNMRRPNIKGSLFVDKSAFYWNVLREVPAKLEVINWFKVHAQRQLPFCKRSRTEFELNGEKYKFEHQDKLSSKGRVGACKTHTKNNSKICMIPTVADEQDPFDEKIPKGEDLNLGEKTPTKDESCDIVDDTSRNNTPQEASQEVEPSTGNGKIQER